MKLIIFLIYTPLVYAELHKFMTTYTGVKGITGMPEFFAVTTLDGQQLDYYDSITQTLIPRQKWLEKHASTGMWIEDTEIRRDVQEIYKTNIDKLMSRFNQTSGIHTYQRIYGCRWNNETNETDGFDMYGFDGEDFITLNLKEAKYISSISQSIPITMKWNENRAQIDLLLQYYRFDCVYWLKFFLKLRKAALKSTAPKVSLLQKSVSSVWCHASGFYPEGVIISWMKNGEKHYKNVEITPTLPNDDGTFQKISKLSVKPEDWHKDQYVCVVEHKGLIENIKLILSNHRPTNNDRSVKLNHKTLLAMILMLSVMLAVILIKRSPGHHKKLKDKWSMNSMEIMVTFDHEEFDKNA